MAVTTINRAAPNLDQLAPGFPPEWEPRNMTRLLDLRHVKSPAVRDLLELATRPIWTNWPNGWTVPLPERFRLDTGADVARLMVIRRMKPLGFSLNEVRSLLAERGAVGSGAARQCAWDVVAPAALLGEHATLNLRHEPGNYDPETDRDLGCGCDIGIAHQGEKYNFSRGDSCWSILCESDGWPVGDGTIVYNSWGCWRLAWRLPSPPARPPDRGSPVG